MPVIDEQFAHQFATEWCAAWTSNDLERILSHYSDDFSMSSPLIAERGFDPSGTLHGKDAVRTYWGAGLKTATPPIRFELIAAYAGVDRITIHYRSIGRKLVCETVEFDAEAHHVVRASACYGPLAD